MTTEKTPGILKSQSEDNK